MLARMSLAGESARANAPLEEEEILNQSAVVPRLREGTALEAERCACAGWMWS